MEVLIIKEYDVLIIGAGPAGLFTAINCPYNKKVMILEKNSSAGKKLLLSGAGQCNITHEGSKSEFLNRYGNNGRFLKHALYAFTNKDTQKFLEERGLKTITRDDGKVFPETMKAMDVLEIFLKEFKNRKVDIEYNSKIKEVKNKEGSFIIHTDTEIYKSKILVIATGGKSYPNTGSTGEGYNFARELGHNLEKPLPALTPVYIKSYQFNELSGISFENIPISLWRNNKKINNFSGDILFTHKGISGPGILNNSRYMEKGDILRFNFLNADNEAEFRKDFIDKLSKNGKLPIKSMLKDFPLPKRFIDKILDIGKISEDTNCAQLKKEERNKLIEYLISYPMEIEELGGFHLAMATRGGIELKEIQPKTMESRLIKGLYFVGEVLDIDGDTGGYNIQAALSTGYVAGKSISEVIK